MKFHEISRLEISAADFSTSILPARVRGRMLAVATLALSRAAAGGCIQVNICAAFAVAGRRGRVHEGTVCTSAAC